MVFIIDDIAEDAAALTTLGTIFYWLFPAAESAAVPIEEGANVIINMMDEEGTSALISIKDGSTINVATEEEGISALKMTNNFPSNKFYDFSRDVVENISTLQPTVNKESLIQKVSILANSLSKKIPFDSSGFKQLVLDMVNAAMQNPVQIIGTIGAVAGIAGLTYDVIQRIKKSFEKGEKIPQDIQDLINDGKITVGDIKTIISDTANSVLPTDLISKK